MFFLSVPATRYLCVDGFLCVNKIILFIHFSFYSMNRVLLQLFVVVSVNFAEAATGSCTCSGCANVNCKLASNLCSSFYGVNPTCSNSTQRASCDFNETTCTPDSEVTCKGACMTLGCTETLWSCDGNQAGNCVCEDCEPLQCSDASAICSIYDGTLECQDQATSVACWGVDSTCKEYPEYAAGPCTTSCNLLNCRKSTFTCP
jgi:hypothetical protein